MVELGIRVSLSVPFSTLSPTGTDIEVPLGRLSLRPNLSSSTILYLGIMVLTSQPREERAKGKAPATSASPPVLAKGTISGETMRTLPFDFKQPPLLT